MAAKGTVSETQTKGSAEVAAHAALKAALEQARMAQRILEEADSDLTLEDVVGELEYQHRLFTQNVQALLDKGKESPMPSAEELRL